MKLPKRAAPGRSLATRRSVLRAGALSAAQLSAGAGIAAAQGRTEPEAGGGFEGRDFEGARELLEDRAGYRDRTPGDRLRVAPARLVYEVAPPDAADHQAITAGGVRLRLLPRPGEVALEAFGALADGGADRSRAFEAALRWCSAHGAGELALGGMVGVGDVTLSDLELDVTLRGGGIRFSGRTHILRLERCRGRIAFEDVDVDGDGRGGEALFEGVEDEALRFDFAGGTVRSVGSPEAGPAAFCRFTDASGGVWGSSFLGWFCAGGQLLAAGYGAFGVRDVLVRDGDGNAVRLGAHDGSQAARPGASFVQGGRYDNIDDSTRGRGQYGNAVSCWRITGHRVSGAHISRVYASFVRENSASGVVSGNIGRDCGLVGGFHELGSHRSVWSGNRFSDCGSDGINAANPDAVDDAGETPTVLVVGNVLTRIGYPTTRSAEALAASLPGEDHGMGKERAAAISLAFGAALDNAISDVAPGRLGQGCGIRTAAQNFNREVVIGRNLVSDADYLVGVGASDAKTHGILVSGVAGRYRVAPIAGLAGGYTVTDLAAGRGDKVVVRDMLCPRSLRPATLAPGSELTDPATGLTAVFVGSDAASGRWSDEVALRNAPELVLDASYFGAVTQLNSGTEQVLRVPADARGLLPLGVEAVVIRTGAGSLEIVGEAGVRVEGDTRPERHAVVRLRRLDAELWIAG